MTFSTTITAVVKQSNKFNDSSGGANLFSIEGAFPTLKHRAPASPSPGRVYQDRNLDNVYTTGTGAFDDSDLPKAMDGEPLREERRAPSVAVSRR